MKDPVEKMSPAVKENATAIMDMARNFFHMEAAGGILLVLAAALAMIVANTGLYPFYDHILNGVYFRIGFADNVGGDLEIEKSLLLWINDGLMAVFFFLVGLEIKREVTDGGLSSPRQAALPVMGALGGMVVPALIFWAINRDSPETLSGWAIPAATDIAFALGVLALLGPRVPVALKILLTAIAVIDDIGAILIIALFYAHDIRILPLYFAAAALVVLFVLNRRNVVSTAPYILAALVLWIAVLESGVHATLAGVVAALFIPMHSKKHPEFSPAKHMEHALHPWVAFGVLPVFGFANAGVPLSGLGWDILTDPVMSGVAAGLFFGKQIGIFAFMAVAIFLGLGHKPEGTRWIQIYAVSVLCGIGFTMSLFIGGLAYENIEFQAGVRLGVIIGSLASALLGYLILYLVPAASPLGAHSNGKRETTG